MRGNCGNKFQSGLPQSSEDDAGVYIPGYRVAPNSGDEYSDLKIRSCPIADMNRLTMIITNYNRVKKGLLTFSDIYKNPTCAIIESFEILDYNHNQMILRDHEQSIKGVNNG